MKRNLTQNTLAELVGINYRHYQSIGSGEVDVKLSTLFRIFETLNECLLSTIESISHPEKDACGPPTVCGSCPVRGRSLVLVLSPLGVVQYCNAATAEILEVSRASVVGKNLLDLVPASADKKSFRKHLKNAAATAGKTPALEIRMGSAEKSSVALTLTMDSMRDLLAQAGGLVVHATESACHLSQAIWQQGASF